MVREVGNEHSGVLSFWIFCSGAERRAFRVSLTCSCFYAFVFCSVLNYKKLFFYKFDSCSKSSATSPTLIKHAVEFETRHFCLRLPRLNPWSHHSNITRVKT